jgi:hypothetical protein
MDELAEILRKYDADRNDSISEEEMVNAVLELEHMMGFDHALFHKRSEHERQSGTHTLYSYCTHTVLYSYCTHTVLYSPYCTVPILYCTHHTVLYSPYCTVLTIL